MKSERSSEQRARAALREHHRIQGDWHDWADWGAVKSQKGERSDVSGEVIDPRKQGVRVQGHKKGEREIEYKEQERKAKKRNGVGDSTRRCEGRASLIQRWSVLARHDT